VTDSRSSLRELLSVMARLRDPEKGCAWDVEQTFATIAPYTIEEAYEVADAIEGGDPEKLRDELGDLLFQVVFHARMAEEKGWFDFEGVAEAIATKLIRRHPHVFGDKTGKSASEVLRQWEDLKERERAEAQRRAATDASADGGLATSQVLADVPRALPALTRAAKLSKRAARVGFDWPDAAGVRAKVDEELREVDEAVQEGPAQAAQVVEEIGDALFAMVNWARHLNVDPEGALRAANVKFEKRFTGMERLAQARGLELKKLSAAEWDALWTESKKNRDGLDV
jgi:MazG family protein